MTIPTRISFIWRGVLATGLFVGLMTLGTSQASAQQFPMTKDQQGCTATIMKDAQKVEAALGKDYQACFKDESKAKLTTTVQECVVADRKGKVASGLSKLAADAAGTKCAGNGKLGRTKEPPFGPSSNPTPAGDAAVEMHRLLWPDLLGDPNDWVIVNGKTDPNTVPYIPKETSKCQQTVIKDVVKCADTHIKEFSGCLKSGIKGGKVSLGVDDPMNDTGDLNACATADIKGKIAKACTDKLDADIAKKCVAPADLDVSVPGCAGAGLAGAGACIRDHITCRKCQALNKMARTSNYCDTCAVDPNDPIGTIVGVLDSTVICVDMDPNSYPREAGNPAPGGCTTTGAGAGCPNEPAGGGITLERCVTRSSSTLTSVDTGDPNNPITKYFSIGVPFVGDTIFDVQGGIDGTGKADVECGYTAFATQDLGPVLGWVCLDPLPGGTCPVGTLDCDGGSALDVDFVQEHSLGFCADRASCISDCATYCSGLSGGGFTYTTAVNGANCGGFCVDGSGACTNDADCPGSDCSGPNGGAHANECQCACTGIGGNASRPGGAQCYLGTTISLERGEEVGGQICLSDGGLAGDVTLTGNPTCAAVTTEHASGILRDASLTLGFNVLNPEMDGAPGGCPFEPAKKLVGALSFVDTLAGDLGSPIVIVPEQ